MEYAGIIISIVGSVIAVGVSWGVITTRVEEIRREVANMEAKIKECPTREGCSLKHDHLNASMTDMKSQLARIEDMLRNMVDRVNRRDKDE